MEFARGLRDGLPICLGYFAVSFAFGILTVENGLTAVEATLISLFNLTSAGQFAGLTIIASMGSYLELALSQFIINLRYMLMSISLSQKLDESVTGIWRFVVGFAVTDEIYAMAISNDRIGRSYFLGLMLTPIAGWTSGTFLGAVLGNILPHMITAALGVALYGMFIAIVVPAAVENRQVMIASFLAIGLSMALYYVPVLKSIPSGFSIIICTVVASAICALAFPIEVEEQDEI